MNMEEARLYCLKLERDRERSWRESRQGAFEASMLSLGELWQSVPATYFEGTLTAVLDLPAPPCANGMVRVVTIGGSATYNVRYENH